MSMAGGSGLLFMKSKELEVKGRIWLERGGEPVLGPGRAALLDAVARQGSISAAARALGMS